MAKILPEARKNWFCNHIDEPYKQKTKVKYMHNKHSEFQRSIWLKYCCISLNMMSIVDAA